MTAILQGGINFQREPWPKVSPHAKDLVSKMLDPDPSTRLTAKEVLGKNNLHPVQILFFKKNESHSVQIQVHSHIEI